MRNIYIEQLELKNYRNFKSLKISSDGKPVILIGANGVGKTNILESISLMFPGKGLRSTKLEEIIKFNEKAWATQFLLHSKIGFGELHTYYSSSLAKRITEFNEKKISTSELCKLVNILWITPQIEGVFLSGSVERRKFIDRIVYSFHSEHASDINKYNHYIRERIKLLQLNNFELNWLKIIEQSIAEYSLKIATNRINTISYLQTTINELDSKLTKIELQINCAIAAKISDGSTDVIEFINQELKATRNYDKISGRTSFGTHRSDFMVFHKDKGLAANLCSTGEQKAMLITILISQVLSIVQLTNVAPIVLLDEVFVHLDKDRREYLIDFFNNIKMQIWVTSNELDGIENLARHAQVIKVS